MGLLFPQQVPTTFVRFHDIIMLAHLRKMENIMNVLKQKKGPKTGKKMGRDVCFPHFFHLSNKLETDI